MYAYKKNEIDSVHYLFSKHSYDRYHGKIY